MNRALQRRRDAQKVDNQPPNNPSRSHDRQAGKSRGDFGFGRLGFFLVAAGADIFHPSPDEKSKGGDGPDG